MSVSAQKLTACFSFEYEPMSGFDVGLATMEGRPMSWNYRVIKKAEEKNENLESMFGVHEVFYDEDGDVVFWDDEPACVTGESFQAVADEFDMMALAFQKPVLMVVENEDGTHKLVEIKVEYEYPLEEVDTDFDDE